MKKDPPKVQTHQYLPGESDHASLHPQQLCATCGYPKVNRRHDLQPQDQAVTDHEKRRIGDKS